MRRILIILIMLISSIPSFASDKKELEEIIKNILGNTVKENIQPDANSNIPSGTEKKKPDKREVTASPGPDELLLKTGIQFFNANMYDNARNKFNELKTGYSSSPFVDSASVWTAKIYIRNNQFDEAIKELTLISESSGEYPSALFFIGETRIRKGETDSAIESLNRVVSMFPENELADDALLLLGRLYTGSNRGNQAIEAVIKIIKFYNDRETMDDAYFLLGKIFETDLTLKDFEVARKIYQIFLRKAEKDKLPYFYKSPLTERVRDDLKNLETTYFKLEN